MTSRPIVFLDGNCQGQFLAAVLNATGTAEAYFVGGDLGFVPSYNRQPCHYIDEAQAVTLITKARDSGRTIVQGTQASPLSDGRDTSYTTLVSRVVRYPHLQCFAQAPEEFEKRYQRRRSPSKILALDLGTIGVCQKRAASKLDFAAFIEEHGRSRPLFHTPLHPGGELGAMLYADFARQLCPDDEALIAHVQGRLASREGINFTTDHPVPASVLDDLGFDWGSQYTLYTEALYQAREGRWTELLNDHGRLLSKFPHETQILAALARAAIQSGECGLAYCLIDELLDLSPGHIHYWLMAFSFYRSQGDERSVIATVDRAKAFFGTQRQFSHLLAWVLIERLMFVEAEHYARDYQARTPDRYDGLIPLMRVLISTDRPHEARSLGELAAATCDPGRVWELKANLANIPEIDWSFLDAAGVYSSNHRSV